MLNNSSPTYRGEGLLVKKVKLPLTGSYTGYTWKTTKYYSLLTNRIGNWESGGPAPKVQLIGWSANNAYFRTNVTVAGLASYLNPNGSNQIYNNTICYQDTYWVRNSYTLTANANGGNISTTTGWTGSGNAATKSVTYGTGYGTLPTPKRTDYKFLGWFTAATGGSQISASTTMGASATTIYAHWDRNKYTIKYDSNGGSGSVANQTVETNVNLTLNANSFNKAHDWIFVGWSRNPHVMNKEFSASQTISSLSGTRNDVVTLYAIWERTNASFIQRPLLDDKMFFKTISIIGQARKHYNVHDIDSLMAHIDNPNGTNNDGSSDPGYFTEK